MSHASTQSSQHRPTPQGVGSGEMVRRASNLRKLLQKEMVEIVNRRKNGRLGIGIDADPAAVKYRQRMRADTRCARFLYHGNIWTPLWRSSPNTTMSNAGAKTGNLSQHE